MRSLDYEVVWAAARYCDRVRAVRLFVGMKPCMLRRAGIDSILEVVLHVGYSVRWRGVAAAFSDLSRFVVRHKDK